MQQNSFSRFENRLTGFLVLFTALYPISFPPLSPDPDRECLRTEKGLFQGRMERIWWGGDKHDSSDTPGTLFHFIKHKADGLGKGLSCDISKNLKRSDTWQHHFIPVNQSCGYMLSLGLFLNKDEFPPPPTPPIPLFFDLDLFMPLRKSWRGWERITGHLCRKCALWHAPAQNRSSSNLTQTPGTTKKLIHGLGFHYQWITQTAQRSFHCSQYLENKDN